MDESRKELDSRVERLNRRALEKYGVEANSPVGWAQADAFDYTINELAGLPRYVDMLLARLEAYKWPSQHDRALLGFIRVQSEDMALMLIKMRGRLMESHDLGAPEYSPERS